MTPHTVLVTGARGFVGRHLVPALREAFPHAAVHEASFDMTKPAEIQAAVHAILPDACLHLAAVSAVPAARQQADRAWQVNLTGTLVLAQAILAFAPACRLLFASSAEAYGRSFAAGQALDETAPLAPMNTYAATKAAADLALGALAADGLHSIRLRLFNHAGPGQSDGFVVATFARQVARIAAGLQPPALQVGGLNRGGTSSMSGMSVPPMSPACATATRCRPAASSTSRPARRGGSATSSMRCWPAPTCGSPSRSIRRGCARPRSRRPAAMRPSPIACSAGGRGLRGRRRSRTFWPIGAAACGQPLNRRDENPFSRPPLQPPARPGARPACGWSDSPRTASD